MPKIAGMSTARSRIHLHVSADDAVTSVPPVPVASSERPDIVLHDKDNSHPNFAGSYLAACVFFAVLFKRCPQGLDTTDVAALARYGPATSLALQQTAWQASKEYK